MKRAAGDQSVPLSTGTPALVAPEAVFNTRSKVSFGEGGVMLASYGSTEVFASVLAEHIRGREYLASLCGLDPKVSVEACGQTWCSYFDPDRSRCALLIHDVYARLGDGALRWFVTHRTSKPLAEDATTEALGMRVGAL